MGRKICVVMAVLALGLTAFSQVHAGEGVLIGISKIVAHPALDALEQGVQDGVKERFPQAKFDLQNANGEMSTAASIAQKFKAESVNIAVGIATTHRPGPGQCHQRPAGAVLRP